MLTTSNDVSSTNTGDFHCDYYAWDDLTPTAACCRRICDDLCAKELSGTLIQMLKGYKGEHDDACGGGGTARESHLRDPSKYSNEIQLLLNSLKSSNWTTQYAALLAIQFISKNNPLTLVHHIDALFRGISENIDNLRSGVSKNAILTAGHAVRGIGRYLNRDVIFQLLSMLTRKASIDKKFVATAALESCEVICNKKWGCSLNHTFGALNALVSEKSKSAQFMAKLAEVYHFAVINATCKGGEVTDFKSPAAGHLICSNKDCRATELCPDLIHSLLPPLSSLIIERLPTTKEFARKSIHALQVHWDLHFSHIGNFLTCAHNAMKLIPEAQKAGLFKGISQVHIQQQKDSRSNIQDKGRLPNGRPGRAALRACPSSSGVHISAGPAKPLCRSQSLGHRGNNRIQQTCEDISNTLANGGCIEVSPVTASDGPAASYDQKGVPNNAKIVSATRPMLTQTAPECPSASQFTRVSSRKWSGPSQSTNAAASAASSQAAVEYTLGGVTAATGGSQSSRGVHTNTRYIPQALRSMYNFNESLPSPSSAPAIPESKDGRPNNSIKPQQPHHPKQLNKMNITPSASSNRLLSTHYSYGVHKPLCAATSKTSSALVSSSPSTSMRFGTVQNKYLSSSDGTTRSAASMRNDATSRLRNLTSHLDGYCAAAAKQRAFTQRGDATYPKPPFVFSNIYPEGRNYVSKHANNRASNVPTRISVDCTASSKAELDRSRPPRCKEDTHQPIRSRSLARQRVASRQTSHAVRPEVKKACDLPLPRHQQRSKLRPTENEIVRENRPMNPMSSGRKGVEGIGTIHKPTAISGVRASDHWKCNGWSGQRPYEVPKPTACARSRSQPVDEARWRF